METKLTWKAKWCIMDSFKLVVYWNRDEKEFIHFDLSSNYQSINETWDWWSPHNKFYKYITRGYAQKDSNGNINAYITYKKEDNHKEVYDSQWGTSIINIASGAQKGELDWNPEEGGRGKAKWYLVYNELPSEAKEWKVRKKSNRISRAEGLRFAVLAIDQECVITGECTPEALEAAHIIPASQKGADCLENMILLRSDLHKLYDRGLFRITSDGRVVLTQSENGHFLSHHYKNLLEEKQISTHALYRVQRALKILEKV